MADDAEARIVASLSLEADPSARQDAFAELAALGAADVVLAAQCAAPLADFLAETTDANEHRQAGVVLATMVLLDPLQLAAAWMRDGRSIKSWTAPDTAFATALANDPATLTRDDVLTLAASMTPEPIIWSKGLTAMSTAARLDDEVAYFMQLFAACPLGALAPTPLGDERLGPLFTMALSICRDPNGLSDLELAGVWFLIAEILANRPSMAGVAAGAGLAEVAMSFLRATEPSDMIRCDTPVGVACGIILIDVFHLSSQLNGLAGWEWPLKLLTDSGLGGVLTSCIKVSATLLPNARFLANLSTVRVQAFEAAGPHNVHRANAAGLVHVCACLLPVDLSSAEAEPIRTQLCTCRSGLRFMLDNTVVCVESVAMTSSVVAVVNAACWHLHEHVSYRRLSESDVAAAGVVLDPFWKGGGRRFRVLTRTLQRTIDCLALDALRRPLTLLAQATTSCELSEARRMSLYLLRTTYVSTECVIVHLF